MITKDNVKDLRFYSPWHFEKYCPGRAGRISAIKIVDIMNTYFTAAGEKDFGILRKHSPGFRDEEMKSPVGYAPPDSKY